MILIQIYFFFHFTARFELMERYDFLKEQMNISNELILKSPDILCAKTYKIKERHGYLKSIGRAQYNPHLDLYISLDAIATYSDEEFAVNIVKNSLEEYEDYLRTL